MQKIVHIAHAQVALEGMLKVPAAARGIVLFAHGSGSGRLSPRNNFVADVLNDGGLATLLIDLLSSAEDRHYQTRFDIDLLAERLSIVVRWLMKQPETKDLRIGLFGASTGAAAALRVAAEMRTEVKAVVSRGGRPDLAMAVLGEVVAPTLLIVGGDDSVVVELNQQAYAKLVCTKQMQVVPHATHLFEEAGCLEEVSRLAKDWFNAHLIGTASQNTAAKHR